MCIPFGNGFKNIPIYMTLTIDLLLKIDNCSIYLYCEYICSKTSAFTNISCFFLEIITSDKNFKKCF